MSFLARCMSQDARSITGKNLRIIASHYNIDISDIKSDKKHVFLQNGLTEHEKKNCCDDYGDERGLKWRLSSARNQ